MIPARFRSPSSRASAGVSPLVLALGVVGVLVLAVLGWGLLGINTPPAQTETITPLAISY